jgi:hypothetical protein
LGAVNYTYSTLYLFKLRKNPKHPQSRRRKATRKLLARIKVQFVPSCLLGTLASVTNLTSFGVELGVAASAGLISKNKDD